MKNDEFEVIVIGHKGSLRNPKLESNLLGMKVTFIDPVRVSDAFAFQSPIDLKTNRSLFGRDLLPGEIGCSLAHENARASLVAQWGLILEDDAEINTDQIQLAFSLVREVDGRRPTIVTLSDSLQIAVNLHKVRRLRYMPGTTLAYIASKSTSSLDKGAKSRIGTADWPLSFANARFFSIWGIGVREFPSASTIGTESSRAQSSFSYYKNVFWEIPQLYRDFGIPVLRMAIFLPLARDVSGRLRSFIPAIKSLRRKERPLLKKL
jgi:hypothetical protein